MLPFRRRARRRGFLIGRALGRRTPAPAPDHTGDLAHLTTLRNRGALTNEEFERAKHRLLDS